MKHMEDIYNQVDYLEEKYTYFIPQQQTNEVLTHVNNTIDKVYEINGEEVCTMQQFFQWAKHTLPQDQRLSGHVNFDGLNDSIWGGFTEAREEKIAIVWHHSHHIRNHDRTKFGILVECFEEIAEGLLSEEYGIEKPTTLEVIFLGEEVQYGKASTNLYIREV